MENNIVEELRQAVAETKIMNGISDTIKEYCNLELQFSNLDNHSINITDVELFQCMRTAYHNGFTDAMTSVIAYHEEEKRKLGDINETTRE